MKKIFSVIIVFLILMGVAVASSGATDYGAMTDDELLVEREAIEREINNRSISEWALLKYDYYVVGEDIGAGKYIVKLIKSDEDSINVCNISLVNGVVRGVYDLLEIEEGSVENMYGMWADDEVKIAIKDGQTIVKQGADVYIKPDKGTGLFMD